MYAYLFLGKVPPCTLLSEPCTFILGNFQEALRICFWNKAFLVIFFSHFPPCTLIRTLSTLQVYSNFEKCPSCTFIPTCTVITQVDMSIWLRFHLLLCTKTAQASQITEFLVRFRYFCMNKQWREHLVLKKSKQIIVYTLVVTIRYERSIFQRKPTEQ